MELFVQEQVSAIHRLTDLNAKLNTDLALLRVENANSETIRAVLERDLKWTRALLQSQNRLDWILSALFAIGGAIFSLALSEPTITSAGKIALCTLGGILFLIPVLTKLTARPRSPSD